MCWQTGQRDATPRCLLSASIRFWEIHCSNQWVDADQHLENKSMNAIFRSVCASRRVVPHPADALMICIAGCKKRSAAATMEFTVPPTMNAMPSLFICEPQSQQICWWQRFPISSLPTGRMTDGIDEQAKPPDWSLLRWLVRSSSCQPETA